MEGLLKYAATLLFVMIPIGTLIGWLLFRRTTAFLMVFILVIQSTVVSISTYIEIAFGMENQVWTKPMNVLCGVLLIWLYYKRVSVPIKTMTAGIDELAKGNFEIEFDKNLARQNNELGKITTSLNFMLKNLQRSSKIAVTVSKGQLFSAAKVSNGIKEKGSLDKAVHTMIRKLKSTISTIIESATQIGSGSLEISRSSQNVASGANEQAVSLEELSASMEEMLSAIQQNAENASIAGNLAEKNAKNIKAVEQSVSSSVESMGEIAEKIMIMQDIAKKTDILAVNASIEASRAGAMGKGFASVATEVRRLAENANTAALHITELAHKTSKNAVASQHQLNSVIPDILRTSDVVQEIAFASNEQQSAADQVNETISQLNKVTQQNASAAEELATSSEEFEQQAQQLKSTVSFFKLTENKAKISKEKLLQRVDRINQFIDDNFSDEDESEEIEIEKNEEAEDWITEDDHKFDQRFENY